VDRKVTTKALLKALLGVYSYDWANGKWGKQYATTASYESRHVDGRKKYVKT